MEKNTALMLFVTILAAVFLFNVPDAIAQKKQITLNFASFSPSTSVAAQIEETWMKEIEQRTSGKVKFNRYFGSTLLTGNNMYEGVVGGIADIGASVFGYTPGRFPLWQVMDLPVAFPSAKVANLVQWEVYKKFKPKELSRTKILFFISCSPCSIWSKAPIRTLEDMKGKQIRATGFAAKMVEALGGTPVGAPQTEVYEMLAKGIVQGTWSSVDVLKSYKQADVVKYLTLNNLYVSTFYVAMNLNKWRSLPSDVQKIIDDFSEKYIEINGAFWDKMHNEGLQYAKENKLEIISLSPNELARWKKAVQPLLDDYTARMNAQKLPGKEFLQEVMTLKEKYSK